LLINRRRANERLANHKKEAELGENGTGQSRINPLNTAIIGTDVQIEERIIKRKAWGSMRHQGIHRELMKRQGEA
ncbi:hypothetical protein T11_2773, partial [Trichinella zimbabwensis]